MSEILMKGDRIAVITLTEMCSWSSASATEDAGSKFRIQTSDSTRMLSLTLNIIKKQQAKCGHAKQSEALSIATIIQRRWYMN
jgi:hypothetical protein